MMVDILHIHRLPNGVRTNVSFAEVSQYTMSMTYLWHNYGIIMGIYGTSIKTPFVLTPSGSRWNIKPCMSLYLYGYFTNNFNSLVTQATPQIVPFSLSVLAVVADKVETAILSVSIISIFEFSIWESQIRTN